MTCPELSWRGTDVPVNIAIILPASCPFLTQFHAGKYSLFASHAPNEFNSPIHTPRNVHHISNVNLFISSAIIEHPVHRRSHRSHIGLIRRLVSHRRQAVTHTTVRYSCQSTRCKLIQRCFACKGNAGAESGELRVRQGRMLRCI